LKIYKETALFFFIHRLPRNKTRGNWPVRVHLQRVQNFAMVYKNKNSGFIKNKNLSKKIHQSLSVA
jgi:hypothetical protein